MKKNTVKTLSWL